MSHRTGGPLRPVVSLLASLPLLWTMVAPSTGLAQEAPPRVALHASSLEAPAPVAKLLNPYRGDPDAAEVEQLLGEQARATGFPPGGRGARRPAVAPSR